MKSRYMKSQKGQNLVEFAVILPIFVIMVLGLIDLSRAMYVSHAMHRLSREGANLATRGNLRYDQVRRIMRESARPLHMADNGAIYIFFIVATDDNVAVIQDEDLESPQRVRSRIFWPGSIPAPGTVLTSDKLNIIMNGQLLSRGQKIVLVETLYQFSSVTPLGRIIQPIPLPTDQEGGSPWILGSKAVFYL